MQPNEPKPGAAIRVVQYLTNSLPHTQSGYTLRTHALLMALQDADVTVFPITRAGYPLTIGSLSARPSDAVDTITYRRLIPPNLPADRRERFEDAVHRLMRFADSCEPGVLHTTTPSATGEVARAAAARLGVPWVYEIRGLPEETWVASHATPAERDRAARSERYQAMRSKETELAGTADQVITLSNTMRDELASRGIHPGKITVVRNGISAELLAARPSPAEARAQLGLATAPFVVGTVSSLVAYEGLDTILRAVALLRADGVDVDALIVGDGVARPGLIRLAAELGLAEQLSPARHAHFPGRVPKDAAPLYMAALDVFLVPRRDDRVSRLVTPLKPLEAAAIGRPVIVSDLPALAEVAALAPQQIRVAGFGALAWKDAIIDAISAPRPPSASPQSHDGTTPGYGVWPTWQQAAQQMKKTYAQTRGATP
jgi:glycosyltransferase involved in cell wall biosynthesis